MLPLMRSRAARISFNAIMGTYSSVQSFQFYALRYRLKTVRPFGFFRGRGANLVRGRLGMSLRSGWPDVYHRLFAPRISAGPSGLLDSPRGFVPRVRHLEGRMFQPGQEYEIGLNLFEMRDPPIEVIGQAFRTAVMAECLGIEGREPLRVSLGPSVDEVRRVRVRFLTPTALKPADSPVFGVLFARIRDRVSTLRALYGDGPLEIDFRGMGELANAIRMTRCEIEKVEFDRVSRNTGQRHPIGGFIGDAEYEGDLAEFIPYLEAARYTGVGRQTVWGNGEIDFTTF